MSKDDKVGYVEKIVPPRTKMIINGRVRGSGFKYKVKVQKPEGGKDAI
jgi:hypothetical protein